MTAHSAFVGIGSNVGDRLENVERAVTALAALGTIVARSSTYRTQPWGSANQPSFANAVVTLQTYRSPRELLHALLEIEGRLGRKRADRWGPRTIDLDLLLFDDVAVEQSDLVVPHPRLRERAFVLVPLAEIDERFAAMRDALPASERAGVVPWKRARSTGGLRESVRTMPEQRFESVGARVRTLARFLEDGDAIRVRVSRPGEDIEVTLRPKPFGAEQRSEDRGETAAQRVDAIKAELVGIFHAARPAPAEGDVLESDRELGYIEALGIRTPVHSMGPGRLIAVAAADGAAVEYGQPLFRVARGH